jgi:hypothetical protein
VVLTFASVSFGTSRGTRNRVPGDLQSHPGSLQSHPGDLQLSKSPLSAKGREMTAGS